MRYKEFIIKTTAFLIIFIICLIIYGKFVITHRPYENTVKGFYDQSEDITMDILIFGTSHTFTSYNPKVFDNMLHINSYNLGISSQYLFSSEYLLNDALKYEKPKLVVFDVYYKFLNKDDSIDEMRKQYNSIDYTKFSIDKLDHVVSNFPRDLYLEALFPGIREHDKWKKFNPKNFVNVGKYSSKEGQYYNGHMGYYQKLDQKYQNYSQYEYNKTSSDWVLQEDTKIVFRNIINKLRSENIEVLFVTSPFIGTFEIDGYGAISNDLKNFFQEENVKYIDLNYRYDELNLNSEDYKDNSHLNISGSRKVSEYLANYIKNNYSFEDRSQEKDWLNRNKQFSEYYLYNGTNNDFANVIFDNQYQLAEKTNVNRIAVMKNEPEQYTLLMEFDYDGDLKELEKYKMSFRGVPSEKEADKLPDDRKEYGYEYWDFMVRPEEKDGKYFIMTNFKTKIGEFKKFSFQLYIPKSDENASSVKIGQALIVHDVVIK